MVVFDLYFIREYDNRADTQLKIGTYATREEAEQIIAQLSGKPGFVDFPAGFEIYDVTLGLTGWRDGFVTSFGPPPKGAAAEAFDLPAWLDEPKS